MTIPCKPYRLFWETVPGGLAVYAFTRERLIREEGWLRDETLLSQIDGMDRPTIYLDLQWVQLLRSAQWGNLVRLGRRAYLRGGKLVLCNASHSIAEVYRLIRLDRFIELRDGKENMPQGNLLLPDPEWLIWGGGLVPSLARTIKKDQDYDLMPILGDALEEAGCTSQVLLDHLHGPGPHLRDCFVLDLLLSPCLELA